MCGLGTHYEGKKTHRGVYQHLLLNSPTATEETSSTEHKNTHTRTHTRQWTISPQRARMNKNRNTHSGNCRVSAAAVWCNDSHLKKAKSYQASDAERSAGEITESRNPSGESTVIDGEGGLSWLTDVGSKPLLYTLIPRKHSYDYTPN